MSSNLDFEFEQVLGSWLDHCSESLSLQQQQQQQQENESSSNSITTLELLQQNDNTGMLLITSSFLTRMKNSNVYEDKEDIALTSNENNTSTNSDDSSWLLSTRSTIDRFKSMIPDNMEKLREIFKVIFSRLRDSTSQATQQFLKRQQQQNTNYQHENNNINDDAAAPTTSFLPKRFFGMSSSSSSSTAAKNNKNNNINKQQQDVPTVLEPSTELAHLIRRAIFYWLIFDTLLQTFPLVACQWCIQCRDVFLTLVEHALPWEYACEWCEFTVLHSWLPLFRNFSSSFGDCASRLEAIALQKRASVALAQSRSAEQAKKRRQEIDESKIRDASTQEMRDLHELTQRLLSALNRHKPNDGRLAVVKLENIMNGNNNDNENDENDLFRVKKENFHVESIKMKAQALQFKNVGNTSDAAWDVDEEYEPGYVAGAQMGTLKKFGNNHEENHQDKTKHEDAAAVTVDENNNNKEDEQQQQQQGGRRAPRVRPR